MGISSVYDGSTIVEAWKFTWGCMVGCAGMLAAAKAPVVWYMVRAPTFIPFTPPNDSSFTLELWSTHLYHECIYTSYPIIYICIYDQWKSGC
jgi:hypothetical protein